MKKLFHPLAMLGFFPAVAFHKTPEEEKSEGGGTGTKTEVETSEEVDDNESESQAKEIVYKGETVRLNNAELNRLLYIGLESLEQRELSAKDKQDVKDIKDDKTLTAEERMDKLEKLLEKQNAELEKINRREASKAVQERVGKALDKAAASHDLTKDDEAMATVVRRLTLLDLSNDPNLDPAKVFAGHVKVLGTSLVKKNKSYKDSKLKDREATVDSGSGGTPGTKVNKFTATDLKKGKVKAAVLARLRGN